MSDCSHKYERSKQIEWIALNAMGELGKDAWDLLVVVFLEWLWKIEFCSARGRRESRLDRTEKQKGYDQTNVFHVAGLGPSGSSSSRGNSLDCTAFSRRIPPLEDDNNAQPRVLHPFLQFPEFDLKFAQILFVFLAREFRLLGAVFGSFSIGG
jgi:hypothetical protein